MRSLHIVGVNLRLCCLLSLWALSVSIQENTFCCWYFLITLIFETLCFLTWCSIFDDSFESRIKKYYSWTYFWVKIYCYLCPWNSIHLLLTFFLCHSEWSPLNNSFETDFFFSFLGHWLLYIFFNSFREYWGFISIHLCWKQNKI